MEYSHKDPYPIPQDLHPNRTYARILSSSMSGPTSEMTAICQYLYHHQEAAAVDGHISACLRGIAIVEMHHLDLLGGCVRQLGIAPKFRYFQGGGSRFWNASHVFYGCDLREMIQRDIRDEHTAIRSYEGCIEVIRDQQIQALLLRIIQDEKLHIEVLKGLI